MVPCVEKEEWDVWQNDLQEANAWRGVPENDVNLPLVRRTRSGTAALARGSWMSMIQHPTLIL